MKQNTHTAEKLTLNVISYTCIVFVGIFSFFFIIGANELNVSFSELALMIKEASFIIHYNNFGLFPTKNIGPTNIMIIFYALTLCCLFTIWIISTLIVNASKNKIRFSGALTLCWIVAFMTFNGIQQFRRYHAFWSEQGQFGTRNVYERSRSMSGMPYIFAMDINEKLQKNLEVEFLTDVNIAKDPYMTEMRVLAYHLYPRISLRLTREGPRDGLLLYHLTRNLNQNPDDYVFISSSKDKDFILAIEKDKVNYYAPH